MIARKGKLHDSLKTLLHRDTFGGTMAEKAPKLKWNQHAEGDDVSYLGPLSYRHFKIIGWLLLVIKLLLPPIALVAKIRIDNITCFFIS